MALTAQEITDIRDDIADNGATEAFTDAEIERAYERTEAVSSDLTRHAATRGILVRQLLMSATKLNDYTAGATSEKRDQVFQHLKFMYGLYAKAVETVEGATGKSIARVAVSNVPRAGRTYPSGWEADE